MSEASIDKRLKGVLTGGSGGLVAKASSFFSVFVVAHLLYKHLGAQLYGVIATVQSFSIAIAFADLGLGSGLVNEIIRLRAGGRSSETRDLVSRVTTAYALIGALLLLFFCSATLWLAPVLSARASGVPRIDVQIALVGIGLQYSIQLCVGVAQRVNFALQRNIRNHLFTIVGNCLQVAAVWTTVQMDLGFWYIIAAVTLVPASAVGMNFATTFVFWERDLRPRIAVTGLRKDLAVVKTGTKFLAINLASLVAFGLDVLLVSLVAGPKLAGTYSINARVFSMINQVAEPFVQVLWPAFQDAWECKDNEWLKGIFLKAIGLSVLLALGLSICVVACYKIVILGFFDAQVVQAFTTVLGYAAWSIAASMGGVICAMLSTRKFVNVQLVLMGVAAFIGIVGKLTLLNAGVGIASVVWTNAASTLLIVCLPGWIIIQKYFIDAK